MTLFYVGFLFQVNLVTLNLWDLFNFHVCYCLLFYKGFNVSQPTAQLWPDCTDTQASLAIYCWQKEKKNPRRGKGLSPLTSAGPCLDTILLLDNILKDNQMTYFKKE
jgi:hypothetical protein